MVFSIKEDTGDYYNRRNPVFAELGEKLAEIDPTEARLVTEDHEITFYDVFVVVGEDEARAEEFVKQQAPALWTAFQEKEKADFEQGLKLRNAFLALCEDLYTLDTLTINRDGSVIKEPDGTITAPVLEEEAKREKIEALFKKHLGSSLVVKDDLWGQETFLPYFLSFLGNRDENDINTDELSKISLISRKRLPSDGHYHLHNAEEKLLKTEPVKLLRAFRELAKIQAEIYNDSLQDVDLFLNNLPEAHINKEDVEIKIAYWGGVDELGHRVEYASRSSRGIIELLEVYQKTKAIAPLPASVPEKVAKCVKEFLENTDQLNKCFSSGDDYYGGSESDTNLSQNYSLAYKAALKVAPELGLATQEEIEPKIKAIDILTSETYLPVPHLKFTPQEAVSYWVSHSSPSNYETFNNFEERCRATLNNLGPINEALVTLGGTPFPTTLAGKAETVLALRNLAKVLDKSLTEVLEDITQGNLSFSNEIYVNGYNKESGSYQKLSGSAEIIAQEELINEALGWFEVPAINWQDVHKQSLEAMQATFQNQIEDNKGSINYYSSLQRSRRYEEQIPAFLSYLEAVNAKYPGLVDVSLMQETVEKFERSHRSYERRYNFANQLHFYPLVGAHMGYQNNVEAGVENSGQSGFQAGGDLGVGMTLSSIRGDGSMEEWQSAPMIGVVGTVSEELVGKEHGITLGGKVFVGTFNVNGGPIVAGRHQSDDPDWELMVGGEVRTSFDTFPAVYYRHLEEVGETNGTREASNEVGVSFGF